VPSCSCSDEVREPARRLTSSDASPYNARIVMWLMDLDLGLHRVPKTHAAPGSHLVQQA
jgi:hypothetical protein